MPKNDYHGFENTGDEPVFMIWGYAGAASLDEAGYIRLRRRPPGLSRYLPGVDEDLAGRPPLGERAQAVLDQRVERDPSGPR